MQFSVLDSAIDLAKKKAVDIDAIDSRLQSFVVGFLIVEIISTFEQRLEAMFVLRAKKLKDVPNANFVAKMLDRKFRSPDVHKINSMLRDHDPALLATFSAALAGTKWESSMNNLMLNRHFYVHKAGSATMTLREVEQAYTEAVKLFDAIARALGLTAADCAHFT